MNMSFPTHNCPATMQVLFRRLGVRQITLLAVIWTVFITMLLAMTACNTAPTPIPSPTKDIVTMRMTALLVGELVMTDGCLRVNSIHSGTSYLLVWPPEYTGKVSIERDTVQIVDRGQTVVWHIGEIVCLGGGGGKSIEHLDERLRPELPLPANCPGPYWVVGSVATSVEASEESAVPSSATPLPTNTPAPTPSPTETPVSQQPIGADITFPFALGNTWVYSGTIYTGFSPTEIFTATYVVTESVAALQSHPPYTIVRIHREQSPSPIPLDDDWWSAESLTASEDYWYIVEDATVYRLREEPDWGAIPASIVSGAGEIELVFPLKVGQRWYLYEKMQELHPDYDVDSMLRRVVQQGAIKTPAATFEKCFQMTDIVGGHTSEMWFCPGVGIVARKADHSGTPMGMHEFLMRYRVQ